MKILQVIDGLGIGGAEKLIVDIVPKLHEKGYTIDVVLLDNTKTFLYKKLEDTKSCRIFTLGKGFYNPFYILKLARFVKQYDIVHVHLFPAQYFTIIAKIISRSKAKFIFTEHNTFNRRITKPALKGIENLIYSAYAKIICITPEVKNVLIKNLALPESKFEVTINGIDVKRYKQAIPLAKSEIELHEKDVVIVMVAGFREQKDQDTLILALKYLPEHYKLLLVGDGARKLQLQQLVNENNLNGRVKFLGIRNDVPSIYKMSDIAVLSSHWEGFGLAAVEAMASGTPLIASDVPGLAEVVNDGGVLFLQEDAVALANEILKLMNDREYYKSVAAKGQEKAARYDITRMVNAHIELYKELLQQEP